MKQIPYEYGNLPIPGGGYVTGFLYSEQEPDVMYIRTDIGGTYRFDGKTQKFISLIPHVTMEDLSEAFPISIAIDDKKPGSLYIACGVNATESGVLAISEDYGESFVYEKMPMLVHGNLNGRGTGERLYVDGDEILYASQQEGLWQSVDRGHSWEKIGSLEEQYLTFVTKIEGVILVGTAGVTTANLSDGEAGAGQKDAGIPMRGHSLYVSADLGASFQKLPEPENQVIDGCRYHGLVAQRWCKDDRYLYVTFASTGRRSYVLENGYSCDSGDTIDGHIVRYDLRQKPWRYEEITPILCSPATGVHLEGYDRGGFLDFGFSGISVSRQTPGMLLTSTIVKDDGDSLFLSMDHGETWKQILYDLEQGEITFRSPYMRPECNGGHSLIHWLSDVKINPFDDNEAWFNSGTGVFRTLNLKADLCRFTDWCDGIEETVHLNVYSMPKGRVQVIDILGDLGGFAFEEPDKPCDNSFADGEGNRYITCINADFSDENPNLLLVTPRGNWTGMTKGGLILSHDQGKTFERLPMPFGLTEDLDRALHKIETPNVNSGWAALSPDGKNIVWSVAEGIDLPVWRVIVSHNGGKSFSCAKIYRKDGGEKTEGKFKVFSDRTDSSLFFGFGEESDFYVSHDGGGTYRECTLSYLGPEDWTLDGTGGAKEKEILCFPTVDFGKIDCANKTEVRGETGKSGVFYLAVGEGGLWKFLYSGQEQAVLRRLTAPGITVFRMGLGLGREGGDYYNEPKAIYFNGIVDGVYGFYRTLDEGRSFVRLNTVRQMYGEINSIDGDCRTFGRFYLATGSNGIKYGSPVQ